MKETTPTTRKAPKPRRSSTKGFDYRNVPIADRIALQGHEAEFKSIARKTIAEVFAHAERLIDAKERLPKRYGEWVKKACTGISIRSAGNYTAAYERFHDRVDEIVALDILPTHLYAMAAATDPAIEEIFGRAEAGETVTGADVTRIIKSHKDPSEQEAGPKVDQPMKKGLLAFMKPPTADALDTWFRLLEELHGLLVAALPDGVTQTRLLKGELIRVVAVRATWLRHELARLTGYDPHRLPQSASYDWQGNPWKPYWPPGRWKELDKALGAVAGVRSIASTVLEGEVRLKLIPPIEWALGRAHIDFAADLAASDDGQVPESSEDGGGDGHDDASTSSAAA